MSETKRELVTVTFEGAPRWLCGAVALPLFAALQQHRVLAHLNGLFPDQFKHLGENWPKMLVGNRDDFEVLLQVAVGATTGRSVSPDLADLLSRALFYVEKHAELNDEPKGGDCRDLIQALRDAIHAAAAQPSKWQKEWPTEPGQWWFYGRRFSEGEPKHYLTEAFKDAIGDLAVVGNGHFWYASDEHAGMWQKAVLPTPPDL